MRQLRITHKKLRGIPRRLRNLKQWSECFIDYFPKTFLDGERYYNCKIPIHAGLVEGKYSTPSIKTECAQRLINACYYLMQAKPEPYKNIRVTTCITLPSMFSSEICIFIDENYFKSHTRIAGDTKKIVDKSLSAMWGLDLPDGVQELGISFQIIDYEDSSKRYDIEYWFFGELD